MNSNTKFYINPRSEVSVQKALYVGKFGLVIFPLLAMIGSVLGAIFLSDKEFIPDWGIGILIGFVLAWLICSLLIVKWKIWAYSRVRNINELRKKAIEEKLLWPDGSWFERTEIKSNKQKEKLDKLSHRFFEKDIFEEDLSIPEEMIIKYGKEKLIEQIIFLIFTIMGLYYLFFSEKYLFAILPFSIATYALFGLTKKPEIKQLKINKEGITIDNIVFCPWSEIENESVFKTGLGSSSEFYLFFYSNQGETKISLKKYKIKPKKLEIALKTYRIRHNRVNS